MYTHSFITVHSSFSDLVFRIYVNLVSWNIYKCLWLDNFGGSNVFFIHSIKSWSFTLVSVAICVRSLSFKLQACISSYFVLALKLRCLVSIVFFLEVDGWVSFFLVAVILSGLLHRPDDVDRDLWFPVVGLALVP